MSSKKNNYEGGLNPLQAKNMKNKQKIANVALDSGAVATLVIYFQFLSKRIFLN